MIAVESPDAYGHTIFCDDIRAEVGGKLTFVGVYAAPMLAPAFPFVLPKLALNISYFQITSNIMPFQFLVFLPGDPDDKPTVTVGVDEKSFNTVMHQAADVATQAGIAMNYAAVHVQFSLNGMNITQSGVILVRATRGDKQIRLGSLLILPQPQPAT
jgi:hypothetical protein